MRTEAGIKNYIYEWLKGLNIGTILQDRKAWDDTTKLRNVRTYIVVDFPEGIEDENAWFHAVCVVYIGCRDKQRFVADLVTLDQQCKVFLNQFEKNDENEGISCIDVTFAGDGSYGEDDHEYQYVFDVYAQKWPPSERND